LRKKKKEVEGETTRDKYIIHTESFSIQLKESNPKRRVGGKKNHKTKIKENQVLAQQTNTHTHNLLVKVLMQKSLRALSREIYESF
jgi:hypothetical protein